jgi:hypothetical protein
MSMDENTAFRTLEAAAPISFPEGSRPNRGQAKEEQQKYYCELVFLHERRQEFM